jgi:glutamyl-tRNA synthetase
MGYREKGYFPQALINFLALLGWNPGTEQELFSMEELISAFSLDRVSKSGAKFDFEKAKWFNHKYLQLIPVSELADKFILVLKGKGVETEKSYVEKVIELIKERATFVEDFWEASAFFFVRPQTYDESVVKKRWKDNTPQHLQAIGNILKTFTPFRPEEAHNAVMQYISEKELNTGQIMNCLRLSLVGYAKGPDLFAIIEMIGVNETLERIQLAINNIKI